MTDDVTVPVTAAPVRGTLAATEAATAGQRQDTFRAYAIGIAAGTQAFTEGIDGALFGTGQVQGDLAKAAGWAINLAVAEWVIRRPSAPGPRGRLLWSDRADRRTARAEAPS